VAGGGAVVGELPPPVSGAAGAAAGASAGAAATVAGADSAGVGVALAVVEGAGVVEGEKEGLSQ
jgi:hypothetical protein